MLRDKTEFFFADKIMILYKNDIHDIHTATFVYSYAYLIAVQIYLFISSSIVHATSMFRLINGMDINVYGG